MIAVTPPGQHGREVRSRPRRGGAAVRHRRVSWFERRALGSTCERDGYTMTFHSQHRPLQAYTDALADAGFLIERIREVGDPSPADKLAQDPRCSSTSAPCGS